MHMSYTHSFTPTSSLPSHAPSAPSVPLGPHRPPFLSYFSCMYVFFWFLTTIDLCHIPPNIIVCQQGVHSTTNDCFWINITLSVHRTRPNKNVCTNILLHAYTALQKSLPNYSNFQDFTKGRQGRVLLLRRRLFWAYTNHVYEIWDILIPFPFCWHFYLICFIK